MSEEIIDLPEVLERVQNDKELLLELLEIYQEDFGAKRQALGQALIEKNMGKIKEAAHSMKGASGNISAKPLYAICLQIEQLAKAGTFDGMDALTSSMDEQFVRLQAAAAKLKQEWAGG